jgi:hypothetical protein
MQQITFDDFFNFIGAVQAGRLTKEQIAKFRERMLRPWAGAYKKLESARRRTLDKDPNNYHRVRLGPAISTGEFVALGLLYQKEQRKDFITMEGLEATAQSYVQAVEKHRPDLNKHFRAEVPSGYVEIFENENGFVEISAAGFPEITEKEVEAFNRAYVSTWMAYRRTFMHGMHRLVQNAEESSSLARLLLKNLGQEDSEKRTVLDIVQASDGWRVHFGFIGPEGIVHTDYSYGLVGQGNVETAAGDARLLARSLSRYFELGYTPQVNVPESPAEPEEDYGLVL